MGRQSRRAFLKQSAAVGAAAALPYLVPRSAFGAGDTIRVAVAGIHGRGGAHISAYTSIPGCKVVALVDPDSRLFASRVAGIEKRQHSAPKCYQDIRKALDDKEIDAVSVATCNHWHSLITIWSCQAGKDVYVEKPVSHNVVEGRRMVEAARKYHRVVQAGTQKRSTPFAEAGVTQVRAGAIGKVGMARTWIHQKRAGIGHGKPGRVPAGVDYAMWQGPAPERPFYPNRFHYNWHWFWHWGTGELGNNGVHAVDIARWGLGVDAPLAVSSGGGKYVFDDDQEVPDTQTVTWEFPTCCLVWEHRMWSSHPTEGSGFGVAFYGDRGTLIIDEKSWRIEDGSDTKARGQTRGEGQSLHVRNFLDCVKSRSKPNADIEIGHLSTRLCHLGNIAYRLGRKLTFDGSSETFHDPEANKLLSREYSHRFRFPPQV